MWAVAALQTDGCHCGRQNAVDLTRCSGLCVVKHNVEASASASDNRVCTIAREVLSGTMQVRGFDSQRCLPLGDVMACVSQGI